MKTGAIILAAGSSRRMEGRDKLLLPLAGRPLIAHSIDCFARCNEIDRLVLVASSENRDAMTLAASQEAPDIKVIQGGERRQDSVAAGLHELAADGVEYVVVHDGARPLVTQDLIRAALNGAIEAGAALCAVPVIDTVKRADPTGMVRSTVDRRELRLAQTPQAFRTDLLLRAHREVTQDATDDAAMVELIGERVLLVPGSTRNIKVTTPDDLAVAIALLEADQ